MRRRRNKTARSYKDSSGLKVVEVNDISFLTDRNHRYNWLQRHFHHHRLRIKVRKASKILVPSEKAAFDMHRFYFIPYDRISVNSAQQCNEVVSSAQLAE